MRVLVTTPYRLDSASGVSRFIRLLETQIVAAGDTVVIASPASEAPGSNLELALRSARRLWSGRADIDVVHPQQFHLQSLLVAVLARVFGKGVVLTVHGRSPVPPGLRGALFRLVERACARIPHELLFVAQTLREEFGGRGSVLPVDLPADVVRPTPDLRRAVRRELRLDGEFVIAYLGRVTEDKGALILLDAYSSLRTELNQSTALLLVGPVSPSVRVQLRRRGLESDRGVLVLGERPDGPRLLIAADAFVLPSFREALPISLLEAMAAGLPVIASSVGDIPTVIRDRETGLLVSPGDAGALTAAIRWIADHPGDARQMGARAATEVTTQRGAGEMGRRYGEVYRRAMRAAAFGTASPA